jgi:pimeloyl-ACP methyl ester carboxylesterase
MAGDYATLIHDQFDGGVDLVLGLSYGGMITFYLAADHPECADHFVVCGAAHEITARGKDVDYRMALGVSTGNRVAAGMAMGEYLLAGDRFRWLRRLLAPVLGSLTGGVPHEHYRHDVMVEAEAERAYSARDVLARIKVPVLMLCGEEDIFFPVDTAREAASLIPDCTLVTFPGQGHIKASNNKRIGSEVVSFVHGHPANERGSS